MVAILLVPFCEQFFLVFITTYAHFTLEFFQINAYTPFESGAISSWVQAPMGFIMMFFTAYFIRHMITGFFIS